MPPKAPPRPPAPRPPTPPPSEAPNGATKRPTGLRFRQIGDGAGHRAEIFGPGGVGKTTLAASAPGPVAFFDLDQSLPRLKVKLESLGLTPNIRVIEGIASWTDLRSALAAPGWDEIKTLVIDSVTVAEELAVAHTLATVPKERGERAKNVEDYGYGKGYQHVYETFVALLGDLDIHARAGRHVILICHECSSTVPNPQGPDWIRYEPRLQTTSSGKASIRLRVKEWADHVLFVGYDVDVDKGKARGGGTATLYPRELPYFMAKSRTLVDAMPLDQCLTDLWNQLLV